MKLPSRLAQRARQTRRDVAVRRTELRGEPLSERESAAGITSPAVKVCDPKVRQLIDEWAKGQQ